MHNQGAKHHMKGNGKISLLLLRKLTYQLEKHGAFAPAFAVQIGIATNKTLHLL